MLRNNPATTFVIAHVASYAENLGQVSRWLDAFPNLYIDFAARLGEIGRAPYTARKFFLDHQDQIFFGSDATAGGTHLIMHLTLSFWKPATNTSTIRALKYPRRAAGRSTGSVWRTGGCLGKSTIKMQKGCWVCSPFGKERGMRLQILGSGAAEGWPAVFCGCTACRRARELGGKKTFAPDRVPIGSPAQD